MANETNQPDRKAQAAAAAGNVMQKAKTAGDRLTGWALLAPGEAGRLVSGMNRSTKVWIAIALGAVILLSANVIVSNVFRTANADLTASGLYSISKSTRRVLSNISEPIDVRVYFSNKLGEAAPTYKRYFERVRALFEQYGNMSGGKLRVAFIEPEPFSDAEDRAVGAGLRGVRLNSTGDQGFFGLVANNSTDQQEVVQFFSPQRERYLEYDMTKLVHKLAVSKKPVIGLMSAIPVQGGQSRPRFPNQQPQKFPKWTIISQVEEFFVVKKVELNAKEIPADVDVLMIVQPAGMSPQAAYAVDQFALSGKAVIAFLDPVPDIGRMMNPAAGGGTLSPEMAKLLAAWGVKFDAGKVAGDLQIARRVQTADRNRPVVTEYISWLAVNSSLINQGDVVADSVKVLNLASAGFVSASDKATTKLVPLLQTTPAAMEVAAHRLLAQRPDPVALLRGYKPGNKALVLAARVKGAIKTAFPGGKPKPKPKKDAEAKDAGNVEAKSTTVTKQLKAGKLNAIVVADTDMLYDEFWVQVREMLGQRVTLPIAHNGVFVVNALENLSGGEALSGLRGRGVDERPFELVDGIRRDAERRFRQKEDQLVKKLSDLRGKLAKVESRSKDGALILNDEDKKAVDEFRGEMVATRKQLRDVKHALRVDIDRLEGWLKFINIAGVPLLFGLGGVAFAAMRRRRRAGRA